MFYEHVFRELERCKVQYLVVGGTALVLHGVVRLTKDLDIFVDFSPSNLRKFIDAMVRLGYKPKVPVKAEDFIDPENREKWKREKNMKVFSFYHPEKPEELIDIFVYEPIKFDEAKKEKKIMKAQGISIPVISIRNLKRLKRLANRPQDLADVEALENLERLEKSHEKNKI